MPLSRRPADTFTTALDSETETESESRIDAEPDDPAPPSHPGPPSPLPALDLGIHTATPPKPTRPRYGFRNTVPCNSPSNLFSVANAPLRAPRNPAGGSGRKVRSSPLPSLMQSLKHAAEYPGEEVEPARRSTRGRKAALPRPSAATQPKPKPRPGRRRRTRHSLPVPTRLASSSSSPPKRSRPVAKHANPADFIEVTYPPPLVSPEPSTSLADLRFQLLSDPLHEGTRRVPLNRAVNVPASFTLAHLTLLFRFLLDFDLGPAFTFTRDPDSDRDPNDNDGPEIAGTHTMEVVDCHSVRRWTHFAGQMAKWSTAFFLRSLGAPVDEDARSHAGGHKCFPEEEVTVGDVWGLHSGGTELLSRALILKYRPPEDPEAELTFHVTIRKIHRQDPPTNMFRDVRGLTPMSDEFVRPPFDPRPYSYRAFNAFLNPQPAASAIERPSA